MTERDTHIQEALTKLTAVLLAASEKCPPERADDYFFVEAALADEITAATKDGRITIEDLAVTVAYQTLYLTAMQRSGQHLLDTIKAASADSETSLLLNPDPTDILN